MTTTPVASGQTVNNQTVANGDELDVSGTANTTTVQNGGNQTVELGGVESNATIQAGGVENIIGSGSGDLDYGTINLTAATSVITNATVESGGTLNLTLKGAQATGTTVLSGGALTINGNAAANGTILQGGTLELESPKADTTNATGTTASGALTFASGSSSRLQIDVAQTGTNGTTFSQAITGFAAGDVIDLKYITNGTITSQVANGGNTNVTVTGTGGSETFTFSGAAPAGLTTQTDAATGGTDIVCFCSGTLIRTVGGDVAVEDLAVGDLVVTASGDHRPIRWIGNRSFVGRFANNNPDALPVCFKAGSIADGVPARDLYVSPKHAMALDGALVPAEHLVNGVSITKAERVDTVTYWHVELDSHDVLIAEGADAESYVDDCNRNFFHNAPSYRERYPDAVRADAVYCAPRLEHGYQLDAIRRRLAERAGVTAPSFGALRGFIDSVDGGLVRGWAQNERYPDAPVCIDVLVDGQLIDRVLANCYRPDLDAAGHGPHAFEVHLRPEFIGRNLEVRRSLDGMRLHHGVARAA